MYTIERDSCWEEVRPAERRGEPCGPDSIRDRLCVPAIALMDTFGVHRATFPEARNAAWSPDGARLAFIDVRTPRFRADLKTITYKDISEGVTIFNPVTGDRTTYPAATDVLSWIDVDGLMLEHRGRRYGLTPSGGELGSPGIKAMHPTSMQGISSPDGSYIYKPGSTRLWSLFGKETESGREGVDEELTNLLNKVIGGNPHIVSMHSFWVRGTNRLHELCLGVTWRDTDYSAVTQGPVRCEVLVVDVQRRSVLRRVPGTLISPARGETQAVIASGGRILFVDL